jgi:hypothetical protein
VNFSNNTTMRINKPSKKIRLHILSIIEKVQIYADSNLILQIEDVVLYIKIEYSITIKQSEV